MSRRRPKTSLVNMLRDKKVAIAAALCVVVALGAYVGVNMFSTRASHDPGQLRGMINDIDKEIKGKKSGGNRKIGIDANKRELGSQANPFVVLEIVPWQGYGEMCYMVSGCAPADIYKIYTGTSMVGLNAMNMGVAVQDAFAEENYPGKFVKGSVSDVQGETGTDGKDPDKNHSWGRWELQSDGETYVRKCRQDWNGCHATQTAKADRDSNEEFSAKLAWEPSGEKTLYGYYEKVSTGKTDLKPCFVLGEVKEDKNGNPEPVFRKAEDGETAEYIWVTVGNSENSVYKNHKAQENKSFDPGTTAAQMHSKYKVGDRYYTSRKDMAYSMGSSKDETCMYYHSNDFLRYSLKVRSKYEVDHFNLVVKTVEPWELNEHQEWIDYADLMYLHATNEYGASVEFYNAAMAKDAASSGSDKLLKIDPDKSKNVNGAKFGKYGSGEYKDKQNDITFEVALKLFKKANKFDEYNGKTNSSTDSNLKMDYAPIIIGSTLLQGMGQQGYDTKSNVGTKMMDWATMRVVPESGTQNTGYNNNVYKFCIMDLLMDQTVFYNNFIRTRVSTGKSVIQIDENGNGIAEPQSGDAQLYWNNNTFLPYNNNSGHWKEYKDKYKLKLDSGANSGPYYTANQGVNNFSMMYNNNGKIYYLSAEDDITKTNSSTDQAFDFYKDQNDERNTLSTLDIIYYMLNYNKSDTGSNGKDGAIEILDIEPCSDFTKMNIDYLMVLFPSSDEYMFTEDDFNLTHMTTSEFNGSKEDLSKYDMIYFGDATGKMNADSKSAYMEDITGNKGNVTYKAPLYNDTTVAEKIFLHVGDRIRGRNNESNQYYRLSGNDVTSLRASALEQFVQSGKALVLPDTLYRGNTSSNPLFGKAVGKGTNTESFLANVRKKDNVYALYSLTTSNLINFAVKGAAVKITDTPPIYNNPSDTTAVKDENAGTGNKTNITPIPQAEDGTYNLSFTFKIGYTSNKKESYAVRLLVDKNGDGIISENETGSDILDTWNSTVSAGQVFKPGTLNDEGEEQPAEYTVTYTIPEEQTNGPIAWKFMVYNTQNESIYYEVSGISLYKGELDNGGEPVIHEIRVLQIISDGKENTKADLDSSAADLFKKWANLKDYKIVVTSVTLSDYLKRFADVNASGFKGNDAERTKFNQSGDTFYYPQDYMENHVFLYSCGNDLQNANNENGAVSFAAWASNNDKSVIYTADSIFASDSHTKNRDLLKDTTGLSRFTSTDGTTSRYNDTAIDSSGKKYSLSDYKSLEYTYHKATTIGGTDNKYLAYKNDLWQRADGKTQMQYGAGEQTTTKGSRANNGTVCIYPYTIGEDLSLSGAKAQDYQLNLEIPDADVWYCLGNYQGRGNSAGKLNSYYAMSPNDAANNYYLFNVDNVFYDAINLEATTQDQEMQLFINTLIGAYEFSYGTPYVTVDKVTRIEDGEAEKLSEDSVTVNERRYSFEVSAGEKLVKTTMYKEYMKQEKDKVVHSAKPKTSAAPTPVPTEEPEPTKAPEPVTLWENQLNQNATTFTVSQANGADWLKGLSNDAIIQFTYTCTEEKDATTPVWDIYGGNDEWTKHGSFTACASDSSKSTDIQVVQMSIANLKELLGVSESADIKYLVIRPANYYCPYVRMLSVKLYLDDFKGNLDVGGSTDATKPKVEEVKKSEVFTDEDTHTIYFTPHEGNVKGSIIKSLMLQFTGVDNDTNGAISLPVTTIYRSLGDGKYQKITCPEGMPGQFNEILVDGKQYFVTYNKENANTANPKVFNKLEMHIQNDRKEGKTILTVIPNALEKPDSDDVYMFNLD